MSRSLSGTTLEAMLAQETGEVICTALLIEHDDLTDPIRATDNGEAVTFGGNAYQPFPYDIALPFDEDDRPPEARLTLDNIGLMDDDGAVEWAPTEVIRTLSGPIDVTIYVINATTPDTSTVEITFPAMKLRSVEYDQFTIGGSLSYLPILDEPFPGYTMTPSRFPMVFGAPSNDWSGPASLKGTPLGEGGLAFKHGSTAKPIL